MNHTDIFMKTALNEAKQAFKSGEVPVGAVLVCKNQLISKSHNQTEKLNDSTAHAEMIALTSGMNALGSKFLTECDLYVTLEPCIMCAGAIRNSRIRNLYYSTPDHKAGYSLFSSGILHPSTKVHTGLFQQEASELLKEFFKSKR